MTNRTIIWNRIDTSGQEYCRLDKLPDGWQLAGTVILVQDDEPYLINYEVNCQDTWATRSVRVEVASGNANKIFEIESDAAEWTCNGEPQPQLSGCTDIDLSFSPSTNLLPIRRLALEIGASANVSAAWLRFPRLNLETLEQTYTKLTPTSYRYESAGGSFTAELTTDKDGIVVDYPGLWQTAAAR